MVLWRMLDTFDTTLPLYMLPTFEDFLNAEHRCSTRPPNRDVDRTFKTKYATLPDLLLANQSTTLNIIVQNCLGVVYLGLCTLS